ncbi:hypothetical protein GH5_06018 [Leishmania sp. Ghana 2012 LV757]|uniref:hypothetical protein n=1 Tax=Leishmania sp. Ghana 2012 LV757 TaxID=2803181 RepID=UPI001B46F614|nr:hypothetical protein GH5_06018 [Leishmania sp. Ghana 2012 LV757]
MFALFVTCLAPKRRLSGSPGINTAAAASRRKVRASSVGHKATPKARRGPSPGRAAGRPAKKRHERCPRTSRALALKPLSASSPSTSSAVMPMANDAPGEAISAPQPRFSPSYVITDAMPVRSRFMNPVDFLSSSEPLMLTPEEKAAEKEEKARLLALQEDARGLAEMFARELAERKAKAIPAGVTKSGRPVAAAVVHTSSRAGLNVAHQQRLPALFPPSSKLAPVAPKSPRSHHKSSFKAKRARGKADRQRRRLKASQRPRGLTPHCASRIRSRRSRQSKVTAAASVQMHKPHQALQGRPGRPRLRPTAAARIRAAASLPRFSAGGKKRPAAPPRRAAQAPRPVLKRTLPKSTVKVWRVAKPKKRIITKLRHRKRKKL